jgi:transposase
LDRLELVMRQIKEVERERDAMLETATEEASEPWSARLLQLRGIGPDLAGVLHAEALFRSFSNHRQVACHAGLAPSPWQSGNMDREQGGRLEEPAFSGLMRV